MTCSVGVQDVGYVMMTQAILSALSSFLSDKLQRQFGRTVVIFTGTLTHRFVECNSYGVELRTFDYENPGSNPVLLTNLGEVFFTLHSSSSLSCINEYQAIDSGGYV